MNIEKWIEGRVVSGVDNEELVITLSDFQSLLETNTIVPREPSVKMLTRGNSQQEWAQNMRLTYKAMIEESEEEL